MRKVFLFVYDNTVGTREQIKNVVNTNRHILTWRYDLPNCFYLVSEVSAHILADSIRESLPTGHFIVTKADEDYWGWSNSETWYLFQNKFIKPNE